METKALLKALRKLEVETGSLACLGCGHEHNCGNLGCAILREAEQTLLTLAAENQALRNAANAYKEAAQRFVWISVLDRLPEEETDVLILVKETDNTAGADRPDVAWWQFVGWLVDGEWQSVYCHGKRAIAEENARGGSVHEVTHWMPLPGRP